MIKNWDLKADIPLVKLIAPERTVYPKISLRELIDEFKLKSPMETPTAQYTFNYRTELAFRVLSPKTPIHKITGKSLGKYFTDNNRSTLGCICRALRWYLNGEKEQPKASKAIAFSTNGDAPVKLKIQSAAIETLADLLTTKGKHLELRMQVLDAIAECPVDQFRVIPATQEIIENEKERISIQLAITRAITPKGWCINWNGARKVFFIVPKDVLAKVKKGGS